MGKGNYASNIRKLEKSYKSGLTKPNMEGDFEQTPSYFSVKGQNQN